MQFDVVVIGAGAAGMMCAAEAGKRGRRVLLIDHADKLAEKIRISGGGRCNFTNINAHPDNYLSANPHFCRSALARFTPQHFIDLLARHGIAWHEKKLGQLFCDDSAQLIIDMLKNECVAAGVQLYMSCHIHKAGKPGAFLIETSRGNVEAQSLVIATGGLSIPQIGATAFGYELAKQFGLNIVKLAPGLVPLTFDANEVSMFADLSGISIDATLSCNGASFRENLLITHRGLSGPAVLQISSYWKPGDVVSVDLLPGHRASSLLETDRRSDQLLVNWLAGHWPKRFAQAFVDNYSVNKPLRQFDEKELAALADILHDWRFRPSGTAGYKKAEVTLGGVDTHELSSRTMEARKVPGLYFIGEVVDVTGWLGGYNFQWAWASGHAAGQFA